MQSGEWKVYVLHILSLLLCLSSAHDSIIFICSMIDIIWYAKSYIERGLIGEKVRKAMLDILHGRSEHSR